jgi:predicted P-loop ATPase
MHTLNVPQDLRPYRQFVTWRLVNKPNQPKPTKVPNGSTTDSTTWKSYDEAVAELNADPTLAGIGFVFTEDDPFVFLDIDNCLLEDGQTWHTDALVMINATPGMAWETSQSGRGLHGIGRADKTKLKRKRNRWKSDGGIGFEFYFTARYVAFGHCKWTRETPGDVTKYLLEHLPEREESVDTSDDLIDGPRPHYSGPKSDEELIKRARDATGSAAQAFGNAATFEDLWTGNVERLVQFFPPDDDRVGFDHSAADAALLERLAFWTGYDEVRMIRLFGQSALGQRDKWTKRPDYRARSVKAVTSRPSARYIGSDRADGVATHEPTTTTATNEATDMTWTPPVVEADKNDLNYIMRVIYDMGIRLTFDMFAHAVLINGREITDADYLRVYVDACSAAAANFPKLKVYDAIDDMARRRSFHPVRDYLNSVGSTWDGKSRLDTWLIDYASAPDTSYVRAVSSTMLIAAVKRVFEPGCKHDEMVVLEGVQGTGKSTLIRLLCADERWFTDGVTLSMETKELMEVTSGRWFVEAAELSRLSGAEAEHVRALLSRTEDRARMAYGRTTTTRAREFIIIGTTNDDVYLQDTTGNRRFLPIRTGAIDLNGFPAVRDQIFAEAFVRYQARESTQLPRDLIEAAREEQAGRMYENEFIEQVEDLVGDKTGMISMATLNKALQIPSHKRRVTRRQLVAAMRECGWALEGRSFVKGHPARRWTAFGSTLSEAPTELKAMPKS